MTNTEKLTQAFCEALMIDASAVTNELSYQGIAEWDSISHMVLISEIEGAFDVSLETDDVIDLSSVAKAKEILTKHGVEF